MALPKSFMNVVAQERGRLRPVLHLTERGNQRPGARQMMSVGFSKVGVLLGGLDAWRGNHEVQPIGDPVEAGPAQEFTRSSPP